MQRGDRLGQELAEQHEERRGDRRRDDRPDTRIEHPREVRAGHDRCEDVHDVVADEDTGEQTTRVFDELQHVGGARIPTMDELAQPKTVRTQ